jgi:hypothetical protein
MVSGYAIKPANALARTEMEAGPARQRRRFTQVPRVVPVQFELTLDELATFEAWFDQQIHSGADWFDTTLINGQGLATMRARIKGDEDPPYDATPQGNGQVWMVKAVFEVEGMPQLTPAQLAGRL